MIEKRMVKVNGSLNNEKRSKWEGMGTTDGNTGHFGRPRIWRGHAGAGDRCELLANNNGACMYLYQI